MCCILGLRLRPKKEWNKNVRAAGFITAAVSGYLAVTVLFITKGICYKLCWHFLDEYVIIQKQTDTGGDMPPVSLLSERLNA
jgi:hypothetical protein